MSRLLPLVALAVFAGGCNDRTCSLRLDPVLNDRSPIEGAVVWLDLTCDGDPVMPGGGDVDTVATSDKTVASVRKVGDSWRTDRPRVVLLAHRPGTVTVTARKRTDEVAKVVVDISPQ
jgi:hypothetical protein